jgi:hypothetical protein
MAVTANEIINAPTEDDIYNEDTGQYEEAQVLSRNFGFNLQQPYSNYLEYHPCREDDPRDFECMWGKDFWWVWYDTLPIKRQRRKVYRHALAAIGGAAVLNLVWYDYVAAGGRPLPYMAGWFSAHPGTWSRAQYLGGVVYKGVRGSGFSCAVVYMQNSPDPGVENWNSLMLRADEESTVVTGPEASYVIARPYYEQSQLARVCSPVGSLDHEITVKTQPTHDYWF